MIEPTIQDVHALLTALCRHLGVGGSPVVVTGPAAIATDEDLSGEWGDPEIRKDPPKNYVGPSFVGKRFSQTTPAYLDALAGFFEWKATKESEDASALTGEEAAKKAKYAGYSRKDAGRARGWAARLRAKPQHAKPAAPAPAVDPDADLDGVFGDDSIPF